MKEFEHGQKWVLKDKRTVTILKDLDNDHIKIINENGMLEVITESALDYKSA